MARLLRLQVGTGAFVAWHGEDDAPGAQDGGHMKTRGSCQILSGK